MHRTRPTLLLWLALAAGLSACTLNVRHQSDDVTASYDLPTWTALRIQPDPAEHLIVQAHDAARVDATLTVETLLDIDDVELGGFPGGIGVVIEPAGEELVDLFAVVPDDLGYDLPELMVEAPMPAGIDVITDAASVSVVGFCGLVTVEGGSSDTSVEVLGPVEINVSSGDLEVFAETGTARTGSGNITADLIGPGRLDTDSGNVDAVIGGEGQIFTGSGDVEAVLGSGGEISTGSGNVTVVLTNYRFGELTIYTGSGNVHVELPTGADPVIDIYSGSGNVSTDDRLTLGSADPDDEDRGHLIIDTGAGNVDVTF